MFALRKLITRMPCSTRDKKHEGACMHDGFCRLYAQALLVRRLGDRAAGFADVFAGARHGVAPRKANAAQQGQAGKNSSSHDFPLLQKCFKWTDAWILLRYQAIFTRSSPRPATAPTMVSPATTGPTPSGVPVKMMSPAFSSNRPDR